MAAKSASKKKKHAKQQGPLVVLYGLDKGTEKGDAIRVLLADLGISARTMTPEHLNDPVGYAAGLIGFHAAAKPFEGTAFQTECMLLCNVGATQQRKLLSGLRERQVPVACKGVLTQTNRNWPFYKLVEELALEHAVMTAAAQLKAQKQDEDAAGEASFDASEPAE